MGAIRIRSAGAGTFTKTLLPNAGIWLPVLPPSVEIEPTANWEMKDLVGVGEVPSPAGSGVTTLRFSSIFPYVYTALCKGLPAAGFFLAPPTLLRYLRKVYENTDIILLSVDEGAINAPVLTQVAGAPSDGDAYPFSGAFLDTPMRITRFSWMLGAETYVPFKIEFSGTENEAHLRSSYWNSIGPDSPVRTKFDRPSGKAKAVISPRTRKPIPLTAKLIPGEGLRTFTQRWLGPNRVGEWRILSEYNGVTEAGLSKGRFVTYPLVQHLPVGQRLTQIAFPESIRFKKA